MIRSNTNSEKRSGIPPVGHAARFEKQDGKLWQVYINQLDRLLKGDLEAMATYSSFAPQSFSPMPMSYSAPIGGSYSGPITGGSYSAPIGKPISYGAPIGQPQMGTLGTVSQVIPASAVPISEGRVVPGTQRAVESSQHWWIGYPEDEPLPGCNIPSHYSAQCEAEDGELMQAPLCKLLRLPQGTVWGRHSSMDAAPPAPYEDLLAREEEC